MSRRHVTPVSLPAIAIPGIAIPGIAALMLALVAPVSAAAPAGTPRPSGAPGLIATPAPLGTPAPVGTPPLDAFVTTMVSRLRASTVSSRYLGPALSALVINADDGSVIWQHNRTRARMPASAQKLLTTYTVLTSLGPTETLATTTCRSTRSPSTVHVRGGGDPSLTRARIQALAAQTATALKRAGRTRVSLQLDGSLFPAPTSAPGWTRSYLRSDVQQVRGLTLAGYRGTDGRLVVGKILVTALKARGVTATVAGTASTPGRCAVLATTRSASVSRLVTDMLARSDNDYAEFLLRHAALAAGRAPSWRGAIDHQARLLADAGVPVTGLKVFDGSGLSRANRTPVATLASVLRLLRNDPALSRIVFAARALPRAGRTGTLADRFSAPAHACARGLVQAKTGTLADAVALAGVARGSDGRERVFVFLDNGQRRISSVRSALDTLATTVVGCLP